MHNANIIHAYLHIFVQIQTPFTWSINQFQLVEIYVLLIKRRKFWYEEIEGQGCNYGVWAPAHFCKRTKVPSLQCPLYIKRDIFLRSKWRGSKTFPGVSLQPPFFLHCLEKRLHWGSLDFRNNHTSKLPTLFPPFMNLQNSIQKLYLLLKVLVCPISWIGHLPSKIPSCAPEAVTI